MADAKICDRCNDFYIEGRRDVKVYFSLNKHERIKSMMVDDPYSTHPVDL